MKMGLVPRRIASAAAAVPCKCALRAECDDDHVVVGEEEEEEAVTVGEEEEEEEEAHNY